MFLFLFEFCFLSNPSTQSLQSLLTGLISLPAMGHFVVYFTDYYYYHHYYYRYYY